MATYQDSAPRLRRSGAQTRAAILDVAARTFHDHGFASATLQQIADQVGITRSAVLHHFGSKDDVLLAVARPFLAELDVLLDAARSAAPLTTPRRRGFLTEFVDLLADHRCVVALLSRDVGAQAHLDPGHQIIDRATRFVAILGAGSTDPMIELKGWSALGAVLRPISTSPEYIDLGRPEARRVLVDCALATLQRTGGR